MTRLIPLTNFILICFLVSCNNEESKNIAEPQNNSSATELEKPSGFSYKYDPSSTEIKWTAFKHSIKAPVGGKFDSVNIDGFEASDIITDALRNISFSLYTSSTNTQDEDRDLKIVANFFGNMSNTAIITGKIQEIEGLQEGSGKVLIKMNETEKSVPFEWKLNENDQFILTANLNVLDWNAENALNILNAVCLEKHTGDDGENKLWTSVEVVVFTTLIKEEISS